MLVKDAERAVGSMAAEQGFEILHSLQGLDGHIVRHGLIFGVEYELDVGPHERPRLHRARQAQRLQPLFSDGKPQARGQARNTNDLDETAAAQVLPLQAHSESCPFTGLQGCYSGWELSQAGYAARMWGVEMATGGPTFPA